MAEEGIALTMSIDKNLYPPMDAVIEGSTDYEPTYVETILLTELDQSHYNEV